MFITNKSAHLLTCSVSTLTSISPSLFTHPVHPSPLSVGVPIWQTHRHFRHSFTKIPPPQCLARLFTIMATNTSGTDMYKRADEEDGSLQIHTQPALEPSSTGSVDLKEKDGSEVSINYKTLRWW